MSVALDATYSLGNHLSGVGVYSRKILWGVAAAHPRERFYFCYRPHRFLRSFQDTLPSNASRRLLHFTPGGDVFHALNQRVDRVDGDLVETTLGDDLRLRPLHPEPTGTRSLLGAWGRRELP